MAQFQIKGVQRETSEDVALSIEADSAANARVKAELQGVIVTEVLGGAVAPAAETGMGDATLPSQPAAEADPSSEDEIWSGGPSQWVGIQSYLIAMVVAVAIVTAVSLSDYMILAWGLVPLVGAVVVQFLHIRCTRYRLSSERLTVTTGILSRHVQDVELFRVKDSELLRPLVLRLLGLGVIKLLTTDATTPIVFLRAVPKSIELRETIRLNVNIMRQRRGVRELDVE
jgi:membrane protein YdbS with pleckstrin-like domain